jgi:glycyl-tRNA synthetase
LDEPIIRDRLVLEINKAKFGPVFKKNAAIVQKALQDLSDSEGNWNVEKLNALSKELESGKATIVASDGNSYEITPEMVSIFMKNEKISGMFFFKNQARSFDPTL